MSYWNGTQWVAEPTAQATRARRGRRFLGASLEASLIVLLMFGLIASTALAAKGGHGNGSGEPGGDRSGALSLRMVVDQNSDGLPNWNDQITFDVSTTATDRPWVRLDCYQSGSWVSTSSAGFFAAYPWPPNFTLASGAWTGGSADCTATLYMTTRNGHTKTLGATTFGVAP